MSDYLDQLNTGQVPMTRIKYSGGSKTERVWYLDGQMCSAFELRSVFEWSAILVWFSNGLAFEFLIVGHFL